jgi:outer membrane protein assembly factor BamB
MLLVLAACARLSTPEGWSAGVVAEDVLYNGKQYEAALYIGTMEGDVRALDLESGYALGFIEEGGFDDWNFRLRGEDERNLAIYGTPAIDDGVLYVAGYDGILYALCLDGRELDEKVVGAGAPIVGSPVVASTENGALVLVGSSDGTLYAYAVRVDDPDRGPCEGLVLVERWSKETGNKVWSSAVVANGVVYFGSLDHNIYAVRLDDGEPAWDAPFETGGAVTATPVIARGRLYVGSFDSVFYMIDAATGDEIGRFGDAKGWFWGGAIAGEESIYAPSLDGKLYALDLDTLSLDWAFETGGPLIGSPVIVEDRIAVPSLDHRVYLVNRNDGTGEEECDVGSEVRASLTAHGDAIYLQASDHSIRMLVVERYRNFWRLEEGWKYEPNADGDPVSRWACGTE